MTSTMPTDSQLLKRDHLFDKKWEDRRWCWGCGRTDYLSRAHIVRYSSIPYLGAKIALQMDIDNMAYLCMNNPESKGCHAVWDDNSWEIEKDFWEIHDLACFVEFMKVIKQKDHRLYEKRIEQIKYWINHYG